MQGYSQNKADRTLVREATNEPEMGCTKTKVGVTTTPHVDVGIGFTSNEEFKQPAIVTKNAESVPFLGKSKVALKPGRSLMDWVRLTHSGQDLTSVGGNIKPIASQELSKHNQKNDAWICLKGKVYNVAPYLEYHPGGEEELMRGVGKDATDLFNEIHRWVNAESMLQKCFIGPLKCASLWLHSDSLLPNPSLPFVKNPKSTAKQQLPKFKWIQTTTHVDILIKSYLRKLDKHDMILDLTGRTLLIHLILSQSVYTFHMELEGTISSVCKADVVEKNAELKISLEKQTKRLWKDLGQPLLAHDTVIPISERNLHYRPCTLLRKKQINHNTVMLSFKLPSETKIIIPVGYHINMKVLIEDVEIIRSYTPITPLVSEKDGLDDSWTDVLHFIVKIYTNGTLTPILNKCSLGDDILISDYIGNFNCEKLLNCQLLIMLAAGTGLTPMIKIMNYFFRLKDGSKRILKLLCFNRNGEDILLKNELATAVKQNKRLKVFHVLSEPKFDEKGDSCCINKQYLRSLIQDDVKSSKFYVCICGPLGFINISKRCLADIGVSEEDFYVFSG